MKLPVKLSAKQFFFSSKGMKPERPIAAAQHRALATVVVEQRIDRPRQLRVELDRTLRELLRCFRLTLALGFDEQPPEAELLRIGRRQHRLEDPPRGAFVSSLTRFINEAMSADRAKVGLE